jgi:hypothetical protein
MARPAARRATAAMTVATPLLLVVVALLAGGAAAQSTWGDAPATPAPGAAPATAPATPTMPAANPNGCIITFDLANAPALVGGSVTTEAGKPPVPLTTGGGVQVGGRLALQLATTACPKTWAELNETGLTGAKIVPTEESTLRLLPGKLTAKVCGPVFFFRFFSPRASTGKSSPATAAVARGGLGAPSAPRPALSAGQAGAWRAGAADAGRLGACLLRATRPLPGCVFVFEWRSLTARSLPRTPSILGVPGAGRRAPSRGGGPPR